MFHFVNLGSGNLISIFYGTFADFLVHDRCVDAFLDCSWLRDRFLVGVAFVSVLVAHYKVKLRS